MRYAIYWLPHHQLSLYQDGQNWFEQTHRFHSIIEEIKSSLSYYDFSPALKIPQKYGFHCELLSPFYLKPDIQEQDIFKLCTQISKTMTKCDIKMCLTAEGKSLLLQSYHKNNLIIDLKKKLYDALMGMIEFGTKTYYDKHSEFQIVLSNTSDKTLHEDLTKIAHFYWQPLLKNTFEVNHFNLCYQKNKDMPFCNLMRFDF